MRKVFLDELIYKGNNHIRIDWKKSVGKDIRFIYDDISGVFKIIDYNIQTYILTILYNNKNFFISPDGIHACALKIMLGKMNESFIYQINDIINTKTGQIKILEQMTMKYKQNNMRGYKYQCLKDNYIGEISEYNLKKGVGCPICTNQKIMVDINDMWTTNPNLAKLLADSEDGYKYTQQSNKKLDWKCPDCGNIIKNKSVYQIFEEGLSCSKCSDGIKYPEKFMYNLLLKLNIEFIHQYVPFWSNRKMYDFYFILNNKEYIIETDGAFHFKYNPLNNQSEKENRKNDEYKNKLAQEHNIEVIRIDCFYEKQKQLNRFEYIKKNILYSRINDLFNLNNINWIKLDEESQESLVKQACDLWNSGIFSTTIIGNILKLKSSTICRYLKQGYDLGWTNYHPKAGFNSYIKNNLNLLSNMKER